MTLVGGIENGGSVGTLATIATTGSWSDLKDATANLTLNNTNFTTTFNQTSAVNWTWANITAATNILSQPSPVLRLSGNYWTGAISSVDIWAIQSVLANGTNGASWLSLNHNSLFGTPGQSLVAMQMLGIFTQNGSGLLDTTNLGFTLQRNTGTGHLDIVGNQTPGTFGLSVNGPGLFVTSLKVDGNLVVTNPNTHGVQIGLGAPSTFTGTPTLVLEQQSDQPTLIFDAGSGTYFQITRNNSTGFLDFTGTQSGFSGYSFSSANVTDILRLKSDGTICIGGTDLGISRLAAASLALGNGTLGDFSGALKLGTLTASAVAPSVSAGQIGYGATVATTASAGSQGAIPATVEGYIIVNVAGTARKIPYYAT